MPVQRRPTNKRRLTKRRLVRRPTKGRKIVAVRNTKTFARLPKSIPTKMVTTMKYATTVRLDPTVGAPVAYNFYSCNSIFDPDTSGIGHQPYTHDTFQTMYNHYKVLKSSVRVTFLSNGSSSTGHFVGGIAIVSDTTTPVLDFDQIRERSASKYRIGMANDRALTVSAGFNIKKMYPNNVSNLNAAFGSNPAEQAYFCVWCTSTNETIDISSIDCVVTINYTVLMWELKALAES